MKMTCSWKKKMSFEAGDGVNTVQMDTRAPNGDDSGLSPKKLVLAGITGCTGMDVVALLKKFREPLDRLEISAEATMTDEMVQPVTFARVDLIFDAFGKCAPEKLIKAVMLSQTRYCGVSAMIARACPIHYVVRLDGKEIARGEADFSAEAAARSSAGEN